MWLINLPDRDALKNFERRRGRNWEGAVGAFDGSASVVKRRCKDLGHAEGLNANARHYNIGDRVECADLVEMDLIGWFAVDFPFGDRDSMEDAEGVFFYERR